MPDQHRITRYLPIAVVVVALVFGFVATNPGIIFGLIDPAGTVERSQQRSMSSLASRETPLSSEEAFELFATYERDMTSGADIALIGQDQRHGLPAPFLDHLTAIFVADTRHVHAQNLLARMARHRALGAEVESAFTRLAVDSRGYGHGMTALAEIGKRRPLAEATLRALLELANTQESRGAIALDTLIAASANGLPQWAIDDLTHMAGALRGSNRSKTIEAIATAGERELAIALVNADNATRPYPSAVTAALSGLDVDALVGVLMDESNAIELRTGALDLVVKRRDDSETVGRALTYAFQSEGALMEAAYWSYSSYGRHHAGHIDVDWRALVAAHLDGDDRHRVAVARAFRFLPLGDVAERERFILDMLSGTLQQQRNTLLVIGSLHGRSAAIVSAVAALQTSNNGEIAELAQAHITRITPPTAGKRAAEIGTGILFWLTFAMPIIAAIAWQVFFTAKLIQRLSLRSARAPAAVITFLWFGVCLGLAALLFVGLLGFGHGGNIGFGVFAVLAAMGAGLGGLGFLLRLLLNRLTPSLPHPA